VCGVLGIVNPTTSLNALDPDEKNETTFHGVSISRQRW